jgi:hypothetical protein
VISIEALSRARHPSQQEDPKRRLARKLTDAIEEYVEAVKAEADVEHATEVEALLATIQRLEQGEDR